MLHGWLQSIKSKQWLLAERISPGASLQMSDLLRGALGLPLDDNVDDGLHKGFSYIYTLQRNVHLGPDGYDNEQAPVLGDLTSMYRRRMWVRGEISLHSPLPDPTGFIDCREHVVSARKVHQSALVTIAKSISQNGVPVFSEKRCLMYTDAVYSPGMKDPLQPTPGLRKSVVLTRMDLLKYSILTKNTHSIHIDRVYARQVERLSDVVVQGPFMVSLVLYWMSALGLKPAHIEYKNTEPCFVGEQMDIVLDGERVLIENPGLGKRYLSGSIKFREPHFASRSEAV